MNGKTFTPNIPKFNRDKFNTDRDQDVKQPTKPKRDDLPVSTKKDKKKQQNNKVVNPIVYTHDILDGGEIQARSIPEIADDVMRIIEKQDINKTKIFIRENKIGHIRSLEVQPDEDHKNTNYNKVITKTEFEEFSRETIKGAITKISDFYSLSKTKDSDEIRETRLAQQNADIGSYILHHEDFAKIPVLHQIINHPTITRDWEVINEAGYHPLSGLYLEPSKMVKIEDMSIETAYNTLGEWLADFPFKDYSDLCNTIALLITMLIRPALPDGELPPLFIITANTQGAGKSTLAQILATVILGETAGSTQLPNSEEEIRKAIGAELIHGTEVVVLDNITEKNIVASTSLASAISEPIIRFRILGKSKMIQSDNNATYILTGNNVDANADLVDRACFIRLSAEKRVAEREFRTETILKDTIEKRQTIFSAVYTIVNEWIKKGKPRGEVQHRSNVWAKYMGGIFNMLNDNIDFEVNDELGNPIRPLQQFLNNDTEARIKANPEFSDWCVFRDKVVQDFNEDPWTVSDVFHIASFRNDEEDDNLLGSWFKGHDSYHENVRRRSLGTYLRANVDKVFGHWQLIANGKKDRKNAYSFKNLLGDNELS